MPLKQPRDTEEAALLHRHMPGQQQQERAGNQSRQGGNPVQQRPKQGEEQDGGGEKMQDAEPDHLVGHEKPEGEGNQQGAGSDHQPALEIAAGQPAGNTADKDEDPGEKGFYRFEKKKKTPAPFPFENPAGDIGGVKHHHQQDIQSPQLIHKVDALSYRFSHTESPLPFRRREGTGSL